MQTSPANRRRIAAIVLAVALAATYLSARVDDDDRSRIIVRGGSLIFDNGTAAMPGSAWSKDLLLDEWKPVDSNYKGISGFAVSFEGVYAPSACQSSTMTGDDVEIEFTKTDGRIAKMKFRKRRSHLIGLFGKNEPKLQEQGNTLTVNAASTVPELVFADPAGHISKVTVKGNAECPIPPPPNEPARLAFHVYIQPKAEQP